jgi:hypothetical protein
MALPALPYKEPDRIVRVFESHPRFPTFPISPANFLDYRERNDVFDDFSTFVRATGSFSEWPAGTLDWYARISRLFPPLGFEPELGRVPANR